MHEISRARMFFYTSATDFVHFLSFTTTQNYEFNIKIVNLHLFSLFPCAGEIFLAPLRMLGLAAKILSFPDSIIYNSAKLPNENQPNYRKKIGQTTEYSVNIL